MKKNIYQILKNTAPRIIGFFLTLFLVLFLEEIWLSKFSQNHTILRNIITIFFVGVLLAFPINGLWQAKKHHFSICDWIVFLFLFIYLFKISFLFVGSFLLGAMEINMNFFIFPLIETTKLVIIISIVFFIIKGIISFLKSNSPNNI